MTGRTWYHAGEKVIATDVKPENFVKSGEKVVPIDIICRKADSPELEAAMKEGARKSDTTS